jgi:hypothetical protein
MTRPWRELGLGSAVTFAVPRDAVAQDVAPVDSLFGVLRGEGYEIRYDYGRYGEDLTVLYEEPGYTQTTRDIDGHTAAEITYLSPPGIVRLLSVAHDHNFLTIRISCTDAATCRLADEVFASVRFR